MEHPTNRGRHMSSRLRSAGLALAAVAALGAAGCGASDDDKSDTQRPATTASAADLSAIKQYLLQPTEQLNADTGLLREDAEAYYALAKQVDFDYGKLLADHRADVRKLVKDMQDG